MSSGITRRSALQGAALTTAAAVAGIPAAAFADEAAATDEAKAAFEAAAAPIAPVEPPASWDAEADVVIVGSGGGGLLSAIRLADAGLSTIVLEKKGLTGGTTRCGGFFVNFGGHRQANEAEWALPSFPYDPNKIVEYLNNDFMQLTGDPDLLYAMAVKGPECIDWMIDGLGCALVPSGPNPSQNRALYDEGQITKFNSININNHLMNQITEIAVDRGVDIRTMTGAAALVVDNGRVVGVQAEDGTFYRGDKAVFLMAGGFEMNRAMLKKYAPFLVDGIANCACPDYNHGEVIRMAQGAGADMCGFNSTALYDGGVWWGPYDEYAVDLESHVNKDGNQAVRQPWLRINQLGQRVPFFSSTGSAYPYACADSPVCTGLADQGSVDSMQPGGGVFVCFDSKFDELLQQNYFAQSVCRVAKMIPEDDPLVDRVPDWQRDWHTGFDIMVEQGVIKKCDTIEELEEALGLRPGVLVAEVEKWNAACAAGEDYVDVYKYDPAWLVPIDEPPYYGCKTGGHIFTTKCGVRINKDMQVIDTTGAVIEGLYAGWHTAGGANGEFNLSGRPFNGMYGDVGQSFVGGFMAADALIEALA